MSKRTVKLTPENIANLPDDKPVVYKILTAGDRNNYTGIAKRGRVRERITEHLPGQQDYIPGAKVQIEQAGSIQEAREREGRIISRSKPRHNKQGK